MQRFLHVDGIFIPSGEGRSEPPRNWLSLRTSGTKHRIGEYLRVYARACVYIVEVCLLKFGGDEGKLSRKRRRRRGW